ncbi:unnamed protein product [Symbiodinium sp. KB8]|nr:unnamed protein product [Symbiodinium sp. KB8]
MAETIGESVEDMMDDAVPEERTNDAKEDREEQSNEESAKQRRLHRERQLSNWVSQHRVVRADLVRSILACQALDFLGSAFRSGSRQKLARLHRKSKATKSIDEFWSHSWQKRPYQKVMSLLFLKNGFAASLLGTIAASIVFALMHYGFLPLIRLSDDITSSTKVPAGQPFLCTATQLDQGGGGEM